MVIAGDITVVVQDDDADDQALDELTGQLHEELLLLDLPDVVRPSGPGADGAKGGLLPSLATLVVSGGFSVAVLRSLTLVVREWMKRSGARKAVLVSGEHRLEIEAASKKTQDAAVDAWIRVLSAEGAAPAGPPSPQALAPADPASPGGPSGGS